MRIGELSRQTGVSGRLLRYYEEQGLLHPRRQPSGYRDYADSDVQTVRRIRTLLSAGLGTSVIAEVLPCFADKGDLLAPTCSELVVGLGKERDRISTSIDDLVSARTILDAILGAADVGDTDSGGYDDQAWESPTSDAPAEPALR